MLGQERSVIEVLEHLADGPGEGGVVHGAIIYLGPNPESRSQ
jgi:hypothetical protein